MVRLLNSVVYKILGFIRRQYIPTSFSDREIAESIIQFKRVDGKLTYTIIDTSRRIKNLRYIASPKGGHGYSRSSFVDIANGRPCTLYVIDINDRNEKFIKIGITSRSTKIRFKRSSDMPYKYKVLKEIVSTDAEYIWNLEKSEHKKHSHVRYFPKLVFGGHTECFKELIN